MTTMEQQKIIAPDGTELPMADMPMLMRLVWWAEQDQSTIDQWRDMLGTWSQAYWGVADAHTVAESGGEESEDAWREVRNGACGSAYCMAGQAVVQNGYRMVYESGTICNPTRGRQDPNDSYSYISGDFLSAAYCIAQEPTGTYDDKGRPEYRDKPGARPEPIDRTATEVLGLTDDETDFLFEGDNSVADLKRYVNGIAWVRNLPLPFPGHEIESAHGGDSDVDDLVF